MILYLASGGTVMNVEGRERELYEKYGNWNRLVTYYDYIAQRNNVMQIINLCMEIANGDE